MFKGFKQFILRGNVVDLAVAVVIGAAFGGLISAFTRDLLTPVIAAIGGAPDFSALSFTVNGSRFAYGDFINAIISFVIISAAVYFFVVLPITRYSAASASNKAAQPLAKRSCPECLSEVPLQARKCAFCASALAPVAPIVSGATSRVSPIKTGS